MPPDQNSSCGPGKREIPLLISSSPFDVADFRLFEEKFAKLN